MTKYNIISGGQMECVSFPWNREGNQKPYYLHEHKLLVSQHLFLGVFHHMGNFIFVVGCLNIFMDEIQALETHLVCFHGKLLIPRYKIPINFWNGL
jgi:hypothetical protein